MTRKEEIKCASKDYINYLLDKQEYHNENYTEYDIQQAFEKGAKWADNHPKSPWIKFTEKFLPQQEPIIIAMKNKNKEDGIWLYDLCKFFGGDYTDNNNWEDKVNWEIPIYWMPIPNLPKEYEIKL